MTNTPTPRPDPKEMKTQEELSAMTAEQLRQYADVDLHEQLNTIDKQISDLQAKRREINRHYLHVGQMINALEEGLNY